MKKNQREKNFVIWSLNLTVKNLYKMISDNLPHLNVILRLKSKSGAIVVTALYCTVYSTYRVFRQQNGLGRGGTGR
jgi:hypothetical protein